METTREQILGLVKQYYQEKFAGTLRGFDPSRDLVHYAGRVFDAEEIVNLVDASLDFYLTANRYAERFEADFADYLGLSDALLVNSGSSANLVALTALTSPKLGERRLKPGDEVITVAAGFPSTVAPIVQNRLVPVFVDVNLGDYTAIPERLADAVTLKTRAIMMAHTMGVPFNLDAVMGLVKERDLWLIEDNCDALGSRYHGQLTGTFGHVATVSFYPAHHITMGEGGCVITNDETLARVARSIRDWGRDCYCAGGESNTCGKRFGQQFGTLPFGYDHKYVYSHSGCSRKVTDTAIACAQLDKLPDTLSRGSSRVSGLPRAGRQFGFPITMCPGAGFARADLVRILEQRDRPRNLFGGSFLCQPVHGGIDCRVVGDLANTDRISPASCGSPTPPPILGGEGWACGAEGRTLRFGNAKPLVVASLSHHRAKRRIRWKISGLARARFRGRVHAT